MTDDGKIAYGFRHRPVWLLLVSALVIGQIGLALQLFGAVGSWDALADDRPVIDGRHPLHLYHGCLGAATLRESTAVTCYDPSFQAGYPKTPVFDAAARPVELMLLLFGQQQYDPAAYKYALLLLCGIVPLVFVATARGFGVPASGTCWAGVAGSVLWWCPPIRAMLDAGELDLLSAGLAVLLFLGGMARYASVPGVTGWLMMAVASVAGWYIHPIAWAGLLPAVAIFYLVNAPRHGLAWHLGAVAVLLLGVSVNLWWLLDWSAFWWLRRESEDPTPPDWSAFFNPSVLHESGLGTGPGGWLLIALAAVGFLFMLKRERCGAVGILLVSVFAALATARLGLVWAAARVEGADHASALIPALAILPSAFAISELLKQMKIGPPLTVLLVTLFVAVGWHPATAQTLSAIVPPISPLNLGLRDDQQKLVEALKAATNREARILIEDLNTNATGWNWTPLLPYLTDRIYLGGLDRDASVEHSYAQLRGGLLAGRPYAEWTESERAEFCRRYNVGWVLCRTASAAKWWASAANARVVGQYNDDGTVVILFEIKRSRSFVLSGQARIERMDRGRIILTDVVPDAEGRVRLSLHYQKQLRAAPLATAIPEKDPHDPVPFLTLSVPGTISRVTLTWEHP
jgi:hypothetical protein